MRAAAGWPGRSASSGSTTTSRWPSAGSACSPPWSRRGLTQRSLPLGSRAGSRSCTGRDAGRGIPRSCSVRLSVLYRDGRAGPVAGSHRFSSTARPEEGEAMKKRGKILIAVLLTVVAVGAGTYLFSTPSTAAAPIEIRFGHVGFPNSLFDITVNEYAKRVNAALKGKVEVKAFHSSHLGTAEARVKGT